MVNVLLEDKRKEIEVTVKYKGVEQNFFGSIESVWLCVNKFFGEFVSAFELADKLTLKVDLKKLLEDCEGVFAFSPEGVSLLLPRTKLTDNETLCLLLLAGHVGFHLNKVTTESVSRDELQTKLGKDAKIVSTRLGELVKCGIAAKVDEDKYRITTFGIVQVQKEILPRVRAKTS